MTPPRAPLLARLLRPGPKAGESPEHAWRLVLLDPDGMPSGDVFLLSIKEVAHLVTWLRRRPCAEPTGWADQHL